MFRKNNPKLKPSSVERFNYEVEIEFGTIRALAFGLVSINLSQ